LATICRGPERETLWALAEDLLPTGDLQVQMPRYTQGLMDLGATVCLPRSPNCLICPVHAVQGRCPGQPQDYPVKTRKTKRAARRPGGCWCCGRRRPHLVVAPVQRHLGRPVCPARMGSCRGWWMRPSPGWGLQSRQDLPAVLHVLTHRDLFLHPVVQLAGDRPAVAGDWAAGGAWFSPEAWPGLGLPAPVRRLLESLE
jgi:A/G-specific adenine glycosylase